MKNKQEESGKPMAHSSGQKEKTKIKQRGNHLKVPMQTARWWPGLA